MTRNHFSKHGGPFFINNGITHQKEKNVSLDLFTIPRKIAARITKGRKKSQGITEDILKHQTFFKE